MTTINEAFTQANGVLAGNWATTFGSMPIDVQSNQIKLGAGGAMSVLHTTSLAAGRQKASLSIAVIDSGWNYAAGVKLNAGADRGYAVSARDFGSGNCQVAIWRSVGSPSYWVNVAAATRAFTAGDVFLIDADDVAGTVKVYINGSGTAFLSYTESTMETGTRVGLVNVASDLSTAWRADDFFATDATGATLAASPASLSGGVSGSGNITSLTRSVASGAAVTYAATSLAPAIATVSGSFSMASGATTTTGGPVVVTYVSTGSTTVRIQESGGGPFVDIAITVTGAGTFYVDFEGRDLLLSALPVEVSPGTQFVDIQNTPVLTLTPVGGIEVKTTGWRPADDYVP